MKGSLVQAFCLLMIATLALSAFEALAAGDAPSPRKLTAARTKASPTIDGKLDEPCWKAAGQWIAPVGQGRCEFGFRTTTRPPHGELPTEATLFDLEGRPGDAVALDLEGKKITMTLGEAMRGSRIVHFMDESAEYVRRNCGVDPETLQRKDRLYFMANKAKIHRAIPESGLIAELDHVDADPPGGENFYRVRVQQRNGQAAWSSPVWVSND